MGVAVETKQAYIVICIWKLADKVNCWMILWLKIFLKPIWCVPDQRIVLDRYHRRPRWLFVSDIDRSWASLWMKFWRLLDGIQMHGKMLSQHIEWRLNGGIRMRWRGKDAEIIRERLTLWDCRCHSLNVILGTWINKLLCIMISNSEFVWLRCIACQYWWDSWWEQGSSASLIAKHRQTKWLDLYFRLTAQV